MDALLAFLNEHANLLLAAITAAYVFLTWKMLVEVRRGRDYQYGSLLTAVPMLVSGGDVHLRVQNVGPAYAYDVSISVSFDPPVGTRPWEWYYCAIPAGMVLTYPPTHPPCYPPSFGKCEVLLQQHGAIVVGLAWKNALGQSRQLSPRFNLADLKEHGYLQ